MLTTRPSFQTKPTYARIGNTKLGYGFKLIYWDVHFSSKKNSAHQNNDFFSDYQKYDGHVLSRQPVLHFNVKLLIKKICCFLVLTG